MASDATFEDLDDKGIYDRSLARVLNESTRNFVVDFGQKEAKIAFDLDVDDVRGLAKAEERPVRWINIWAPNRQTDLIDYLGEHYKFTPRLCAIIKSVPLLYGRPDEDKPLKRHRKPQRQPKDDIEAGATSIDTLRPSAPGDDFSHYAIAKKMVQFQSNDIGPRFLCIGANWTHGIPRLADSGSLISDDKQWPLWTWLVLCDDNTIISLHEDPGSINDVHLLKSLRGNTHSILSQLSCHGREAADPISIQTIRQTLASDTTNAGPGSEGAGNLATPGSEGASNLFYYLFDDWRAVYSTISKYRTKLDDLQSNILNDAARTSNTSPNIEIIPSLHRLGRQIRQSDHLYAAYQSTIKLILKSRASTVKGATNPSNPGSATGRVVLAESASQRFERLSNRIQFLILNETQEFLTEKDALVSTFFNINAQKDTEATARLTRAATLLAKLSVLFLPVSLMTAYFSVQITEIEKYTLKNYWDCFAIIVSISFVCLFFFSRLLMVVTETLDIWVKTSFSKVSNVCGKRRKRAYTTSDADDDKLQ